MTDAPKDHRRQDVLAYKQGFLEGDQLAEFEAHLRDCAACQATLEKASRFLPALEKAFTPKLRSTPELWASVQAQFRAQQQAKKRPRRKLIALRLGLSAAAISAGTTIFFVARPLLQVAGPEIMNSPHRPPAPDAGVDAGVKDDAGTAVP